MSKYTRRRDVCLPVEDPEAHRELVFACLHTVFRGDDWNSSTGIHDYLNDENLKRSMDGSKAVAVATRLVDTLTPVDVNELLNGSGCKIYHESPREPLVKCLFDDRDQTINNLLFRRPPPSGKYFAHFPQCLKNHAEKLRKFAA